MHRIARVLLVAVLGLPLLASSLYAEGGSGWTTVYVVRHTEKAAGDDPPLTELGTSRALALADLLRVAGLDAVYSTPYRRSRDTVAPLAAELGLEVLDLPLDTAHLAEHGRATRDLVLAEHRGESVILSGHSNTVPLILEAFGVFPGLTLEDADYGDLFVVAVAPDGAAHGLRLRFGDP